MEKPISYAYLCGALEGVMKTLIFKDDIPSNWEDREVYIENLIKRAKDSEREYTNGELQ